MPVLIARPERKFAPARQPVAKAGSAGPATPTRAYKAGGKTSCKGKAKGK